MPDSENAGTLIYVVDDSPEMREICSFILDDAGYFVADFESAEDALSALANGPRPALVLTDMNMPPGMNGLAFSKSIREAGLSVPIIIMTVEDDQQLISEALEKYADDFMIKPVAAARLQARIRYHLRRGPAHH